MSSAEGGSRLYREHVGHPMQSVGPLTNVEQERGFVSSMHKETGISL